LHERFSDAPDVSVQLTNSTEDVEHAGRKKASEFFDPVRHPMRMDGMAQPWKLGGLLRIN
jgi:hypothetical protein